MKYDLSIIIPSRNEEFLTNTIDGIVKNKRGKTQVIVGLDGQWPTTPIKNHPDVVVLFFPESIGQRAISNRCARVSDSKYLMKVDAHCAFDEGFDVKMLEKMEDDITMVPVMRNLHAFDWVCKNGHRRYQSPSGPCKECGEPTEKDIKWIAKKNPQSVSYCFDSEPHFQYFKEWTKTQTYKDQLKTGLTETMSLQGSCFMLTREKYWELNICDENFGSWGSQGIEVAVKTWLSGGRCLVNHTTFYAHMFRTQGGDFSFPYPQSSKDVAHAKKTAKQQFIEGTWGGAKYPLQWLLRKFWPVKGWTLSDLESIGSNIVDSSVSLPCPDSVANLTPSFFPINVGGKEMSFSTVNHSGLSCTRSDTTENVLPMCSESEMCGITTPSISTNVVNNRDISTKVGWDRSVKPSVDYSMNSNLRTVETNPTVTEIVYVSSPNPTTCSMVNSDFREKPVKEFGVYTICDEHSHSPQFIHQCVKKSKGILYYTNNKLNMKLARGCRKQLEKSGLPITSISTKPLDFGKNIVYGDYGETAGERIARKVLKGLESMTEDIVYFAESDVLYHPDHFKFIPKDRETWYYNGNYWFLRQSDGFAIHYNVSPLSGLVVHRESAIKHFRERIKYIEENGFSLKIGYEPFTHKRIKWDYWCPFEIFMPEHPNVDVTHGSNASWKRWNIKDFRNKPTFWEETTDFNVPSWDLIWLQ